MFKVSSFKFQGVGKYNTINFSRGLKDIDPDELAELKTLHARLSLEYKDCYIPLRLTEKYISIGVLNTCDTKPEFGMYYDTTMKIQKYTYNGKIKLRAVVNSIKVATKSLVFEDA